MKKCLVIGAGPSKKLVTDIEFDGEIICCKQIIYSDQF